MVRLLTCCLLRSIENPLSHLTPDQLEKDARNFARFAGLEEHQALIGKGARIAKDPQYFTTIPGVTDEEKEALRDERRHRFRQPPALYLTIIVCSIGAAVQGWDQTGSNGANLYWPRSFGLNTDERSNDFWILGLVNGSACSQTWIQLFVCRLLLGVGMGAKAATIPVLAAENAPASIRGTLVMGWQLWVAFGIFLGFTANLILYRVGSIAWRLQLGSAFLPAVPLIILVYFCPESPRWYIKKHRYEEAFKSLSRLRNTPVQAARDLYYIYAQVRLEEEMLGGGDIIISDGQKRYTGSGRYYSRLVQLFTIPRIRRATLAAFVVMIAQQMCGISPGLLCDLSITSAVELYSFLLSLTWLGHSLRRAFASTSQTIARLTWV
ncbi:MAG: hypothetical protein LQ346_006324 [Caloplaca aetnensis]|nr:MAG: hypothetical protein LQ346_006324 [Caloplaca aetnensis]